MCSFWGQLLEVRDLPSKFPDCTFYKVAVSNHATFCNCHIRLELGYLEAPTGQHVWNPNTSKSRSRADQ